MAEQRIAEQFSIIRGCKWATSVMHNYRAIIKENRYYGDFVLISNEKMDTFHDKSETFKKDKVVINWLNNLSMAKVFDCFDTVQDTTVNSNIGKASWRTEAIKG